MNNNYYKMTKNKSKLVRKIANAGVGTGLSLLPIISNAQDYNKIQKGVNAATIDEKETPAHVVYHFNFNKDLQRAIKNSKKPHLYLTGDKDSYILVDSDTSGYNLYYSKKNFDESGKGKKTVLLTIKGDEHVNPCDNTGLGSKTNSLVSFYYTPTRADLEQPKDTIPEEFPKELPERQPDNIYNVTEIKNITNNTYNYYGDTAKVKEAQQKLSPLELRAIIDAGKVINPLNSPFYNFSLNPQLYNSSVGVGIGPYLEAGVGKERETRITDVESEFLLNQSLQLFTGTKGTRQETLEKCFPIEWGAILSAGTKDNRVRFDFGYGFVKEDNSTSGVSEFGVDYMRQCDEIINQKDYGPIYIEEGKKSQDWRQTQHVGVAVSPFNNGRLGLKGKVKHIGKPGSEDGFFLYEVGLTGTLGGGKYRK